MSPHLDCPSHPFHLGDLKKNKNNRAKRSGWCVNKTLQVCCRPKNSLHLSENMHKVDLLLFQVIYSIYPAINNLDESIIHIELYIYLHIHSWHQTSTIYSTSIHRICLPPSISIHPINYFSIYIKVSCHLFMTSISLSYLSICLSICLLYPCIHPSVYKYEVNTNGKQQFKWSS